MRQACPAVALLLACCSPAGTQVGTRDAQPMTAVHGDAFGSPARGTHDVLGPESLARITLENYVGECTSLAPGHLTLHENLEILELSVKWLRETGHCGCKSSTLAYRVIETFEVPTDAKELGETGEYQRTFGVLELRPGDTRVSVVITSDHRGFAKTPLKLRVQCRGPD